MYWMNALFHSSHFTPLEDSGERLFDWFLEKYTEPQRFYHTITHLETMTELAMLNLKKILDLDTFTDIMTAILTHDLIYDPQDPYNELRSSEKFLELIYKFRPYLPQERTLAVQELILSTCPGSHSPSLFKDLDLAILASRRPIYRRYALDIRREYQFVPREAYLEGRRQVLETFLKVPQIFTGRIDLLVSKDSLEIQARANLAWEIHNLPFLIPQDS